MIRATILLVFFTSWVSAQLTHDTIVERSVYRSFLNSTIHEPIAVTYTLFHGGGPASRDNDRFTTDPAVITLGDKDYSHSGYDRGHMAPAEDFAYSDSLQAITFRYYNCVPQHPKLNRGPWKHYETEERRLSQTDTITVVCFNYYECASSFSIPIACYKAVYTAHHSTPTLLIGLTNDSTAHPLTITPEIEATMQRYRDSAYTR